MCEASIEFEVRLHWAEGNKVTRQLFTPNIFQNSEQEAMDMHIIRIWIIILFNCIQQNKTKRNILHSSIGLCELFSWCWHWLPEGDRFQSLHNIFASTMDPPHTYECIAPVWRGEWSVREQWNNICYVQQISGSHFVFFFFENVKDMSALRPTSERFSK